MITEFPGARQIPGEPRRRWFSGGPFDLIVWLDDASHPIGFQLCYRKGTGEWAYTWHKQSAISISRIDDGEGRPGRFKMTPVLVPDGEADTKAMLDEFRALSSELPEEYTQLVERELSSRPGN